MNTRSGALPAQNLWLPERGTRRLVSGLAAHTVRSLAGGVLVQVLDVCAANDGATLRRRAGDSDTTAAPRPVEPGRGWPALAAPASPGLRPLRRTYPRRLHRAILQAVQVWKSLAKRSGRMQAGGSALPQSGSQ